MITIRRSDSIAIHIDFDYDGARALLGLLQNFSESASLVVEFDRGVTKSKRFSAAVSRKLVIKTGSDEIPELDETVELSLESETIKYFIARLENCVETKEFNPAELCKLFVRGRNVNNDAYCILKRNSNE